MERGFSRGNRRGGFQGESHQIKCSSCGADATVPFKPAPDRPVFCRDCFQKQKSQ